MDPVSAHRVRRVRWQARVPTPRAALALRGALAAQQNLLAEALDDVLTRLLPAGGTDPVIRLARVHLRVRADDPSMLETELWRNLADQLQTVAGRQVADLLRTDGIHRIEAHGGTPAPADPVTQAMHVREELIRYLAEGRLPWSLRHLDYGRCMDVLRTAAHALHAEGVPTRLERLAPDERIAAYRRWLALLPEALRTAWIGRMRPPAHDPSTRALVDRLRAAMERTGALELQALWLAWSTPASGEAQDAGRRAAQAWSARDIDAAHGATHGHGQAAPVHGRDAAAVHLPGAPLARHQAERAGPDPAWTQDRDGDAAGLPVLHAGLALLHPFLPRLFAALGVASGGGPLDAGQVPRAISLLHWLATGRQEPQEFEWPLLMVLLGREPDASPALPPPALSAEECGEAGQALEAVRTHWPAMRGTSLATLRGQFLQRRGVLLRPGPHWTLHPDRQSFDLLLAKLPWSLQWIRFPWMASPLEVLWPPS